MNDNMRKFIRGLMVSTVSQGVLPKKREPVAYLYNGVSLPPLPEWDREAEPYAMIAKSISTKQYSFRTSSSPIKISDSGTVGGLLEKYRVAERWQWVESEYLSLGNRPLWANYDVYSSDGTTLLLAASEPSPLFTYPVFDDWLYNGEVLPAPPEWDKANYPYAFIDGQGNSLYVTKKLPYYDVEEGWMSWAIEDDIHALRYDANDMRTEWSTPTELGALMNASSNLATWANFDVYGDDGALYLAASEPVPVYE